MTGRTHCTGAVAAVSLVVLSRPLPAVDANTLIACGIATLIGGLAPDLDKPGSSLWRKVPGGCLLGWLARPAFVGGHRHLSHSVLGTALMAFGARALLMLFPPGAMEVVPVLACFTVAFLSHLVLDSLTEGGVPWLFPFGGRYGFPPIRSWRLKTGHWGETLVVLPALWVGIGCLWGWHWPAILHLFAVAFPIR